ncbi:probable multidrug resistance protein [Klebsiella aerogenes]|nr:probable multidrug resistance protein [Klebsiella aerogenes]
MLSRSAMALVTALLMFPQIAETIYSPALTDISAHFSVSAADAAQTLAVYFIGFAVGVLFWGWFSDRRGRRPALLLGLAVYTAGCMLALAAPDFRRTAGGSYRGGFRRGNRVGGWANGAAGCV